MTTMFNPAHPRESLRNALAAEGWTVAEAVEKLGCTRQTFSRLLNGRTGISPALALERIGWSNAAFWLPGRRCTISHESASGSIEETALSSSALSPPGGGRSVPMSLPNSASRTTRVLEASFGRVRPALFLEDAAVDLLVPQDQQRLPARRHPDSPGSPRARHPGCPTV